MLQVDRIEIGMGVGLYIALFTMTRVKLFEYVVLIEGGGSPIVNVRLFCDITLPYCSQKVTISLFAPF